MNVIAENIARRRKELGMTQRELAEKLNISDKTLSRWETDKQVPDALMIPEIAKVMEMSIGEIYGILDVTDEKEYNQKIETLIERNIAKEEIDYTGINTYRIVLLAGLSLMVLGSGIYGFMGTLWNYMKFGSMVLLVIGLAAFIIAELTFEEFYRRKENPDVYEKIRKQWFESAVPLIGLTIGVVIPALKTPATTLFNNWDTILPLMLFQGSVLILYSREEKKKTILYHLLISLGMVCIIGFLINVSNNPYRYMGGFTYEEWELEKLWLRIKLFELAAGVIFFLANLYMSKETLGVYGKTLKRAGKITGISLVVISLLTTVYVHISNKNLQSKVTYTAGEVPTYQLTNYSYDLIDWIKECDLRGEEICMRKSTVYRGIGETATAYLIYLPHGSADTELEIKYKIGWNGNVLQVKAENTTQIMDDNYYLCYLEVLNNGEECELQMYLDGERVCYEETDFAPVWNVFE